MARWRLTDKHYLNVTRHGQTTQWVREETNRDTGRVGRTTHDVPTYLDPNSPGDQNYPDELIVSHEKGAHPRDYIFSGMPTLDMEPLDEEATRLTMEVKAACPHPIDSLAATGMTASEVLLETLTKQLEVAATRQMSTQSASTQASDEVAKLREQVKALTEANTKLMGKPNAVPNRS